MKQIKPSAPLARQRGVALLEGLMAILLISIALIGLMGLQANMLKNTGEARDRNEAARVVQQQVAALWASANPGGLVGTQSIPTLPPNGSLVTAGPATCPPPGNCTYTITATWTDVGQATTVHNITFVAIR